MGYYNIFKIIRLCLKYIFGNKTYRRILIIIMCFILFIIIKPNLSKATIDFVDNGNIVSLPDPPSSYNNVTTNYYYIYKPPYTPNPYLKYYLLTSEEIVTATSNSCRCPSGANYGYMYSFVYNDGIWNSWASVKNGDLRISQWLYASVDLYDTNGNIVISTYKPPQLMNSISSLESLSFNNFIINSNSYTQELENNDGTLFMLFYNRSLSNSSSTEGLYPIKEKAFTKGSIYTDYENSTSDNMVFSYPIFNSGVFFNIGSTYEIRFAKQVYNSEYNTNVYEYLGEPIQFTVSSNVTQDYINQLNQQIATSIDNETTQDLQNSINNQTNAINNQTQSIDNINNSITNSTVDNTSINLPTDNTQDPTQNGVDNIFQTIYNSFTSGTAQDIVFPIPFTNKSITLQANYLYNVLQNNNASWVVMIIQAFWWYLISRFIITDIMNKIRKIKQGNFDNIQNSNIKEDML